MALISSVAGIIKTYLLSKNIFLIALALVGVGFIIAFHELGHFLFCKLFGIRTPSFSIGMGPRIFTKKIGETDFSLSAIPMGGYVEIANIPEEGVSADQAPAYFANKPYWQKMLVMSGGILFNIIFAYFVFIMLYWVGMPNTPLIYPENAKPVISSVLKDSPAEKAQLKPNDHIVKINDTALNNDISVLYKQLETLANQSAKFTIERDNKLVTLDVALAEKTLGGKSIGYLGAGFATEDLPGFPFITAVKKGIHRTTYLLTHMFSMFKAMFAKRDVEGLGGPIMIFSQTIAHAERGLKILLAFLAIISINLALINIVPLPILDGGQALFATLEAIIQRPLNQKIKEYIQIATWLMLITLLVLLSIKDVRSIKKSFTSTTTEEKQK